ncbi:MAG: hypothetical protein OHK0022_26950 [Roseiflexaceae bacterium]
MTQHPLFQKAVQAARTGNRTEAFNLMRQVILAEPGYVPAWLWMSGLVDDLHQQRECLARALALDPNCEPARTGLELLRLRELPPAIPQPEAQRAVAAGRIGDYLLRAGIISKAQLDQALAEQIQRQSYRGERVTVGDILIERGWLSPNQLASLLIVQQQEKLRGAHPPQRLGEYLVANGVISHDLLATVLTEQIALRRSGQQILLGDLLIQGGYVTQDVLNRMLDRQFDDLFAQGGF